MNACIYYCYSGSLRM